MRFQHAFFARNALRGLVAAAALGSVQVASAQAVDARFNAFMGQVMGNGTTVTFGGGGQPLVTSSAGLGTPAIGNMGLSQSGTGVSAAGTAQVPLGDTGRKVAVAARAPISRAAFIRGLGAVVSGPAGALLLATSAPLVIDWLSSRNVQVDPAGGFQKVGTDNEYACQPENNTFPYPIGSTQNAGCGVFPAGTVYLDFTALSSGNGGVCRVRNSCHESVVYASWGTTRSNQVGWVPASLNDIIEYMDAPEAPALTPSVVHQGVTKAGIDPFGGQYPKPSLSGPATVPGSTSSTSTQTRVIPGTTTEVGQGYTGETQPAVRTSTQAQTHNVTYNDNRVSYNTTNNTTTTVTNTVTGASDSSTSTETTEDDSATECEKNPQSLACADLDVPDGEIPKATFDVGYQVEDTFGSGSCPAQVYGSINGQQMLLYDWAQTCGYVSTYIRPLLLVLCAFGALLIVMPGGRASS